MSKEFEFSRRDFVKTAGLGGLSLVALPSIMGFSEDFKKKFDIGATFILWGYGTNNLEPALKDMSKLGYHSFETFGHVFEHLDGSRRSIDNLFHHNVLTIKSAFCITDYLDPSKKREEF